MSASKRLVLIFSLITFAIAQKTDSSNQQYSNDVFDSKGCTPYEFTPTCYLECNVYDKPNLQPVFHKFMYYYLDSEQSVELPSVWSYTPSGASSSYYSLSLQLSDYNSGTYQCNVDVRYNDTGDITNYVQTFVINPSSNHVRLNSQCAYSQECVTLKSSCVNGACQCSGANSISYNVDSDSPACLPVSIPGGDCLVDPQCKGYDPNTQCVNTRCVYGDGGATTTSTPPTEQYNVVDSGLSGTDIVVISGIAFGVVAEIIIIVILIIIALRTKRRSY